MKLKRYGFIIIAIFLCGCGLQESKTPTNESSKTSTEEISESHKENVSLEELESRCLEVEEKYDIEIVYGGKVVDFLKPLFGDDIGYCYDEELNYKAVEDIDKILSRLPNGFFKELRTYGNKEKNIIIGLCSSKSALSSAVDNPVLGEIWMVNAESHFDVLFTVAMMESIENHIKYKNEGKKVFEDLMKYNPKDFEYSEDISSIKKYVINEQQGEEYYFMEYQCLLGRKFDCGVTWGALLIGEGDEYEYLYESPHIRAKAEYICSEIDKAFDSVDETAYWNRFFVKE